jgi:hypothetical protein
VRALLGLAAWLLVAQIAAAQTYTVVDTGQIAYFDDAGYISAPGPGGAFYGQDAQYTGAQPSYTLSGDGKTVYDNNTGLTWQQSPDLDGDGDIDAADKRTWTEFQAYPATLNAQNYGGYGDWRLPTIKELFSLIDFSGTDPSRCQTEAHCPGLEPFIDGDYFDFAYGDTNAGERVIDSQYASSTMYLSTADDELLFGVNFADGRIKGYGLAHPTGGDKTFLVMCVRGNPDYGINNFADNGDGTITDLATGLMWMQIDSGSGMSWEDTLAYAEDLAHAGYDDWRLPNVKELQSILDYARSPDSTSSAAIDPLFNVTPITNEEGQLDYPYYWAATTHEQYPDNGEPADYVAFGRGLGYMNGEWRDVHGAGCQRSDPKIGDPGDYPFGRGPQGDAVRIFNYVRCVRDSGSTSPGGEYFLDGKKLLIRDKATDDTGRKIVLLSRDGGSIPSPASSPITAGATLTLQNMGTTNDAQTLTLDPGEFDGSVGWKALGNPAGPAGYKYLDKTYANGACRLVLLKPGKLLKAVCKGSQIEYTLNENDQVSIAVKLSIGATDYCMMFDDNPQGTVRVDQGTDESRTGIGIFKAIDAPAPGGCFVP